MNDSVKLVEQFEGVYMPSSFEIAQHLYGTDDNISKDVYVDSVRRRVHNHLRSGVDSGIIVRVKGKNTSTCKRIVYRYTTAEYANNMGLTNVPYPSRRPIPKSGVIKLINKCIGEMITLQAYRHKNFLLNDTAVDSVMDYIKNSSSNVARTLRQAKFKKSLSSNVLYVIKNMRGVLNDNLTQF